MLEETDSSTEQRLTNELAITYRAVHVCKYCHHERPKNSLVPMTEFASDGYRCKDMLDCHTRKNSVIIPLSKDFSMIFVVDTNHGARPAG